MAALLLAVGLLAGAPSLLLNGGYESGRGWELGTARLAPREGGRCLRFEAAGGAQQQLIPPRVETLTVAVDVRTEGITPTAAAGYAYAAVYQLDADGDNLLYKDFVLLQGDHPWQRYHHTFELHPRTRTLAIRCGIFQAAGLAEFDNWTLVPGDQPLAYDPQLDAGARRIGPPRAGILSAEDLPVRGTASSPAVVRAILAGAGFEVDLLAIQQLADPAVLQPARYDLVVVPTGAAFPAAAREAWLEYLHRGGSFISLGGYAFDDLLVSDRGRWRLEREVNAEALRAAEQRTILPDGGFEGVSEPPLGGQDQEGRWRRNHQRAEVVSDGAREGARCARVTAAPGESLDERKLYLDLPCQASRYRVSGWLRTADVTGPGMAYIALYQYAADGKLVTFRDFAVARGTTDWQRFVHDAAILPGAARLHLKLGLYRATGTAWFDDIRLSDISGLASSPINSATGKPGDGLQLMPNQVGAFDPSAPLKRVVAVRTARGQKLTAAPVELLGPLAGWQATGVLGQDNARWVPLLEAFDRYGRPRGAAAALIRHYGGYFAGSQWAIFGIDNRDLLPSSTAPVARLLAETARAMVDSPYLHGLRCDQDLYRTGERASVTATIEHRQSLPVDTTVRLALFDGDRMVGAQTAAVAGEGDSPTPLRWEVTVPSLDARLGELRATLLVGGKAVDELSTGFVPERLTPPAIPPLRFAGNVFSLGGRPLFLFGTDTYAYTYRSAHENPLTWDAEHRAAREIGLDLYENLQYNQPNHAMTERDWRSFKAMSQLVQDHGMVFMPGLLIGHNVVADEAELARQSAVCRGYAEALGGSPALLWYINGDYQLKQDTQPQITELWNRWLAQRYSSRGALAAAWSAGRAPQGGELPFPPESNGRWDDPVQVDRYEFLVWLMQRWNDAHVAALRAVDRDHPITSEYYQQPFGGIDLRLTIAGQDVSNIGYFDRQPDDLVKLPWRLAWNDLRRRGKGLSLGEYGVKTHPAWSVENGAGGYHITRTEEAQAQLFMGVAAYTLGLGGSKIQNWCLRDAQTNVFPWGLFYPHQMIPKDVAYLHRNEALLWRLLEPSDRPHELAVCLPSRMRLGNADHLGVEAGHRCFETLLDLQLGFDVVDDFELANLAPETRALVLPAPFAMADSDYGALVAWVRRGGRLLVTGDLSRDERRQPNRAERLEELCRVRLRDRLAEPGQAAAAVTADLSPLGTAVQLHPVVSASSAGAEVIARGPAGQELIFRHQLGQGSVVLVTDALELRADSTEVRRSIYHRFASESGLAVPAVVDAAHLMERPTATGRVVVLFDRRETGERRELELPGPPPLTLAAQPRWPALAHLADDGRVRLVVSDGAAARAGARLFSGRGRHGLAALDDRDLANSQQLLLAPFSTGRVELPARSGRYTASIGEVVGGVWRSYETLRLPGDGLVVEIDDDRRTCLVVVAEEGQEAAARERLVTLANEPWRLRGW